MTVLRIAAAAVAVVLLALYAGQTLGDQKAGHDCCAVSTAQADCPMDAQGKCPMTGTTECPMKAAASATTQPTTSPAATYVCTMCPAVKADKAGKCPKCGMDLVKQEPAVPADAKPQH